MKNILFVHVNMYSGGSQKSLVTLLNTINYSSYNVDLFLFRREGLFLDQIPSQVKIICPEYRIQKKLEICEHNGKELITRKRYLMGGRKIFYSALNGIRKKFINKTPIVYTWKYVSKKIKKQEKKYDVAIAYSEGYSAFFVVDKVNARKKICWLHAHSSYSEFYKEYYRKMDLIVAVSNSCLDTFTEAYPEFSDKVCIMKNIISGDYIRRNASGKGFCDGFNGIRILTVARVAQMKGLDLAQAANTILFKKGYKVRWYVIGDCQNRHHFKTIREKSMAGSELIFLGEKINPYPFIKECDIYVQPSRVEPYGLAVDEAIILDKPVVVTRLSSFYHRLKDSVNAMFAECTSESIAQTIEELIGNQELVRSITNSNKKLNLDTSGDISIFYSMLNKGEYTIEA